MNKKQLIKTIEELNELLVDPDGPEAPMSTEGTEDELCAILIKEALRLIEPADKLSDGTKTLIQELCDDHLDEMDAKTIEVLERCGYEFSDPDEGEEEAPEDAPEDDDNLELVAEVNSAERLKDLKEIAKSYDEFKSIRGELSAYKTADELRDAMLEYLEEEPEEKEEEPEEEKKPAKAEKKPAAKKEEKVKLGKKSSTIDGLIVGAKVRFTSSSSSKKAPNKKLIGEIVSIKIEPRDQNEYVRIKTKLGYFHKVSKYVEIID